MEREIISTKQGTFMMVIFVIGSSIVLGSSVEAKQDIWIAIVVALFMSLPMLFVYSKLLTSFPGKNLYYILEEVFGKVAGKIISLLYVWYSFHLGALVLRNFSEFVQVISLPETPQTIIIIFLGLVCLWAAKAGIEIIGRWTAFIFPVGWFVLLITIPLSMSKMHLINIKPVLHNDLKPVLSSAFSFFTFPFAETVIFTTVFNTLRNKKKTFKVYLSGTVVGGAIILLLSVRNILVLGVHITTDLYFPSYMAVRTLSIGDFIQRTEITVATFYTIGVFIKASVCLYAASKGVAKILNIEKSSQIVAPIGFLMMNLACIVYSSTMEMFDWINTYKYYAIPFQIIIPVITLIIAKIKFYVKN
ncbi:MAG: endospore germination permease [Bacillota bacterium]|nr:endospore germination permease [Bacillota bacterium]